MNSIRTCVLIVQIQSLPFLGTIPTFSVVQLHERNEVFPLSVVTLKWKLTLNKPDSIEELKAQLKDELSLQYNFNLQYEEPAFNNALCNLTERTDLPERATLKLIPLPGWYGWKKSLKFKTANYRTKLPKAGCEEVALNGVKRSKGNPYREPSSKNIKRPKRVVPSPYCPEEDGLVAKDAPTLCARLQNSVVLDNLKSHLSHLPASQSEATRQD
ncbi:hypothetical protein QTP86_010097 [Hemibagrus guttatus]|nr:hypothetical protein QTP86_010097 [Hemibagrus guttatus]